MNEKRPPASGPKTGRGKARSSKNSTKHGMRQQRFLLLPGESPEEFAALREQWRAQYASFGELHSDQPALPSLLETLLERDWLQQRCTRNICALELRLFEAESQNDEEQIERLEKRLQNAHRYKTAAENSFARALRNVEQFRKTRVRDQILERRIVVAEVKVSHDIAFECFKAGILPSPEIEAYEFQKSSETPLQPASGALLDPAPPGNTRA